MANRKLWSMCYESHNQVYYDQSIDCVNLLFPLGGIQEELYLHADVYIHIRLIAYVQFVIQNFGEGGG